MCNSTSVKTVNKRFLTISRFIIIVYELPPVIASNYKACSYQAQYGYQR